MGLLSVSLDDGTPASVGVLVISTTINKCQQSHVNDAGTNGPSTPFDATPKHAHHVGRAKFKPFTPAKANASRGTETSDVTKSPPSTTTDNR